ncbi:Hypothetical_protein [Hexamita inflata]|uniref:Hypothetical_protein n=1 Tax=Hexamita inflata TaxID=28002 RepID=A0ABP1HH32_9EUKA
MQQPLINSQPSTYLPKSSKKVVKEAKKARKENRITLDLDSMFRFADQKHREVDNKKRKEQYVKQEADKEIADKLEIKHVKQSEIRKKLEEVRKIEEKRVQHKNLSVQDIKNKLNDIQQQEEQQDEQQ